MNLVYQLHGPIVCNNLTRTEKYFNKKRVTSLSINIRITCCNCDLRVIVNDRSVYCIKIIVKLIKYYKRKTRAKLDKDRQINEISSKIHFKPILLS